MERGVATPRGARAVLLLQMLTCVASALLLGSAAMPGQAAMNAVSEGKTIQVAASTTFASTGVVLAKGETARLTATGRISYGSQGPASCRGQVVPPSGCAAEAICPAPGGCGALIGRLSGGAPFLVGERRTVNGPGSLELGINDVAGAYGDNVGSFTVTIARPESKVRLSGTVSTHDCTSGGACAREPLRGVAVRATGAAGSGSAVTGADGSYSIQLKKGSYTVTPSVGGRG